MRTAASRSAVAPEPADRAQRAKRTTQVLLILAPSFAVVLGIDRVFRTPLDGVFDALLHGLFALGLLGALVTISLVGLWNVIASPAGHKLCAAGPTVISVGMLVFWWYVPFCNSYIYLRRVGDQAGYTEAVRRLRRGQLAPEGGGVFTLPRGLERLSRDGRVHAAAGGEVRFEARSHGFASEYYVYWPGPQLPPSRSDNLIYRAVARKRPHWYLAVMSDWDTP